MPGNKSKTRSRIAPQGRHGRLKSKKGLRMVSVRTPGGRTAIHFKMKKPSKAKCGNCGKPLAGVPGGSHAKIKNLPKTKKRPERPYGGVLCNKCTRDLIKKQTRAKK